MPSFNMRSSALRAYITRHTQGISIVTSLLVALPIVMAPVFAYAESLADAVSSAYDSNPMLLERRASQRALDESYAQARAGWLPTLSIQTVSSFNREVLGRDQGTELLEDATGNLIQVGGGGSLTSNSGSVALQASQPIYTGGRVEAAVSAAEADVLVGEEGLRADEIRLVQSVVQAYADVQQAHDVLRVRLDDVEMLNQEVAQASTKVKLGQATQIDLAQALAQQSVARTLVAAARNQLVVSSENYRSLVGHPPASLSANPLLPVLPQKIEDALQLADTDSPVIRQAQYADQAARFRVTEAKAARRPTASANFALGYTGELQPFSPNRLDRTFIASVAISQPLYSGGLIASQVHQAMDREEAARYGVEDARRTVFRNVAAMWSSLDTFNVQIKTSEEQVRAARLAFEGVREENKYGMATTLDLVIEQRAFRDAELSVIQSRHDAFIGQANLLSALGRLEARQIIGVKGLQEPSEDLRRIQRRSELPTEIIPQALDKIG